MLFALAGMMLMATATDLLVIFLALEVLSLAVYVLTGIRRDSPRHRGGVQVLPARRVLERLLPLRHRVHVRRHRQHAARSDRQPDGRAGDGADADAAARAGAAAGRLRVQGVGGAVPHVDARRLRGRAGDRHRLHVDRRQGRGVCGVRARVSVRVRAASARMVAGALGDCGRDDDRGHRGRRGADQRQADAGVLEHRARRLPARRAGVRRTTSARARCCSTC